MKYKQWLYLRRLLVNITSYLFIPTCLFRCFTITQGGKEINRGISTIDGCEEKGADNGGTATNLVKSLRISLSDNTITHKCCSWACCNYNATLAALASPPTVAPNISIAGLVWPGSSGGYHTDSTQLMILMILTLNLFCHQLKIT